MENLKHIINFSLFWVIIVSWVSFLIIDYTDTAINYVISIIVLAVVILILRIPKPPDEGTVRGNIE